MASQFTRDAKIQIILSLWLLASPILGLLFCALTWGANETTLYFWLGLAGMIAGYFLLVGIKWDQIQNGDLISWGLSPNKKKFRPLYVMAYLFMLSGFLLAGSSGLI